MNAFTKEDLKRFQSEPLNAKFQRSFAKIGEWYSRQKRQCYVSFSGGKDSTVLADLCAKWCKLINEPLYLVFVNTGLEYPEIRHHVEFFAQWLRDKYEIEVNLEIIRPKMRFDEVIKNYGYPVISKVVGNCVVGAKRKPDGAKYKQICGEYETNGKVSKFNYGRYKPLLYVDFNVSDQCCAVMKKAPMKEYCERTGKKPIIATMACESENREMAWLRTGCNAFEGKSPQSKPMSFWTEQDVLEYIKKFEIPIASVYGSVEYAEDPEQMRLEDYGIDCGTDKLKTTGCSRTGCIFCGFGCHLDREPSRFQRLKQTHPRQYEYCIGGGEYDETGKWIPNKEGLGLGHVFDELNKIYGDDFIKYK